MQLSDLALLGALRFLIVKAHRPFTTETAAGWEFEFMLLVVALALALMGGGKFALDRALFGR